MIISSIFTAKAQNEEYVKVLPVNEYRDAISAGDIQLVDVRTRSEFQAGHIPNAVNIDFLQPDVFSERFEDFKKDEPVFIYCRSGNRSQAAASKLVQMGFQKVYDLEGGYINWN